MERNALHQLNCVPPLFTISKGARCFLLSVVSWSFFQLNCSVSVSPPTANTGQMEELRCSREQRLAQGCLTLGPGFSSCSVLAWDAALQLAERQPFFDFLLAKHWLEKFRTVSRMFVCQDLSYILFLSSVEIWHPRWHLLQDPALPDREVQSQQGALRGEWPWSKCVAQSILGEDGKKTSHHNPETPKDKHPYSYSRANIAQPPSHKALLLHISGTLKHLCAQSVPQTSDIQSWEARLCAFVFVS